METPSYIINGIIKALEDEIRNNKTEVNSENPEWDEWEQHGEEWVKAQWPQAKTR